VTSTAVVVTPLTRSGDAERAAQAVVLSLVYSLPAVCVIRSLASVGDPDIWWHLAVGKWILQHKSIPRTDYFSAYGTGKPWAAYSWLFETISAWLVAHLGLMGLVLLNCLLVAVVVMALHRLIASFVQDFTMSVLLTIAATVAMNGLFTPRPWLLTMLFFIVELQVVLQVREKHQYRQLLWLPLIFCVWANLHVQFIYGLFLLTLTAGEAWLNWYHTPTDRLRRRARDVWATVLLLCIAATLVNPYFIYIYKVIYQYATQTHMLNIISELHAIPFRSMSDYLLLFIGLAAIGALGWNRERQLFPWALLVWAMLLSLRSGRDMWLLAIVGTVTIASRLGNRATIQTGLSKLQTCSIVIGIILVTVCVGRISGLSPEKLERETARTFPAAAVEAVKAKRLSGPLFNDLGWGGYFIWNLPEFPVSMDGRTNLHGTPRIERSLATWRAEHDWNADPELQNARLIIGEVDAPLCAVLRLDPRYEVVYEDKVASVFVRRDVR
jgi:hypothetical protein